MSKREISGEASLIVIATPAPRGAGRHQARLYGDDRILCVSRTPFFDAARELVAIGYDPNTELTPPPRWLRRGQPKCETWDRCLADRRGNKIWASVPPLEAHSYSGGDAKDCFRRAGGHHPSPAPDPGSWQ